MLIDEVLNSYKELMLKNNTEGPVHHYVTWLRRFEDWRQRNDLSANRDALEEFDSFLRDGDAVHGDCRVQILCM
jgi:hypothetical protein